MAIQNFSWIIPDKLAGSAMPGKSISPVEEYVLSDLRGLYNIGIRCLLSLRNMPEFFSRLCQEAGIQWLSFPIPDFGIPSDLEAYERIIREADAILHDDTPLCVHCYAGIGRTGIVLASIVGLHFSIDGHAAIDKVRNCRLALETEEQITFVNTFLDSVNGV